MTDLRSCWVWCGREEQKDREHREPAQGREVDPESSFAQVEP